MVYQNVRGLDTKLSKLFVDSHDFMYSGVIVLTEIWLRDSNFNVEILSSKYQTYRYNRNTHNRGCVLVAVSSFNPSEQLLTYTSNFEFVAVIVKLKTSKVYLSCLYISPDSDSAV